MVRVENLGVVDRVGWVLILESEALAAAWRRRQERQMRIIGQSSLAAATGYGNSTDEGGHGAW